MRAASRTWRSLWVPSFSFPVHQTWRKRFDSGVRGNQDRLILEGPRNPTLDWVRSDLGSEALAWLLESVAETRIFGGHTHVPRIVRLSSGETIINPGSVGVPAYDDDEPVPHVMQSFSPHARYVTLDASTVSFHQVEYDWHAAATKARALGRDDWARGIATGRMT